MPFLFIIVQVYKNWYKTIKQSPIYAVVVATKAQTINEWTMVIWGFKIWNYLSSSISAASSRSMWPCWHQLPLATATPHRVGEASCSPRHFPSPLASPLLPRDATSICCARHRFAFASTNFATPSGDLTDIPYGFERWERRENAGWEATRLAQHGRDGEKRTCSECSLLGWETELGHD
jgi:hypothetical protein